MSAAAIVGFRFNAAQTAPSQRLASGQNYSQMPADYHHRYIDLPLDHANPKAGTYRGFYILSPHFDPKGPVVFLLTDGQMELVAPSVDPAFFDEQLPALSWVVIGHRGHDPAQFPEVFPHGKLDPAKAMKLYGSWQQVEDIERVRQDMDRAGLLPTGGSIDLFGASGAGVLAQQYLARHGDHVARAMLVSTGAPDLAQANGWTYARNLSELDDQTARALQTVANRDSGPRADLAYLTFQLSRNGAPSLPDLRELARAESGNGNLTTLRMAMRPSLNWTFARTSLGFPAAAAAKVRMFELLGHDLSNPALQSYDYPLYVWSKPVLADFIAAQAPLPDLRLSRKDFKGEVLVVSGREDAVFSPAIGKAIADAYSHAQFVLVAGGHRLERDRPFQHALRAAFFRDGLSGASTHRLIGQAR